MAWKVELDTDFPACITYEKEKHTQIEEGHGVHNLSGVYYTLKKVEIFIAEGSIDITDKLTPSMQDLIFKHINNFENDV
jgi:hypothetical protein